MIISVILVIGGTILGASIYHLFNKRKQKQVINERSIILIERIQNVLKIVTVEGDFSETLKYANVKPLFFNLIRSQKKALIIVKAKAIIGYDLSKVEIYKDEIERKITLTKFPEPEIIGIETDLEYYDFNDNTFNRFKPEELTELNREAKSNIIEKIPESGLLDSAKSQALKILQNIEEISQKLDWKLEYKELSNSSKQPSPNSIEQSTFSNTGRN